MRDSIPHSKQRRRAIVIVCDETVGSFESVRTRLSDDSGIAHALSKIVLTKAVEVDPSPEVELVKEDVADYTFP